MVRALELFHRPTHPFYKACVSKLYKVCPLHVLHCVPVTVSYPFHGYLAGIAVTYTPSNGDRVPATVIPPSKCGQHVSIEYLNVPSPLDCTLFVGRRGVYAIPVANGFALLRGHFGRGYKSGPAVLAA